MKKTVILSMILVAGVFLCGCNAYLDTDPTDRMSDKLVWTSPDYADLYINNFYAYLDRYGQFGSDQFSGNLTEGLTDTFKYGSPTAGSGHGDSNMYAFYPERITRSGNLMDCWTASYERIRRINEFLNSMASYSHFSSEKNDLYAAQARFFRAYLYFQLIKRYGGVILYSDMKLEKDKARASLGESWDLVETDLDFAASILPEEWDAANKGRITRYAALAFKSRAMLYAERWDKAAEAADQVIAAGKYSLMEEYSKAWKGNNAESILEFDYSKTGPSHTFDKDYVPYGDYLDVNGEENGGHAAPTQEMVEEYETKDGKKVDWTPWHTPEGTTVPPPYEQLEPRFQATILYHGSTWKKHKIESTPQGRHGRYMDYRADAYAKGRTTTGYYLRKLLDESLTDGLILYARSSTQPWVELRLAEVYLNRAEANFRMGKESDALADLKTIRARVGLPVPAGISGKAVFDAIRRERKLELAYEGHLYWDMRRWKLAHIEYEGYRVHGLKVTVANEIYTYTYVDCDKEDRHFLERTYLFPIPDAETLNNSLVEQNEDWK